jgi:PUA-domain protein
MFPRRNSEKGSSNKRHNFSNAYFFQAREMNVETVTMKKIVVKKRHSIRKSQAQDLLSRLFDQIGNSAKFFHADMIEVLETNADVSLFLVNKKPLLMDTGDWVFPTLKGTIQFPFPERRVVVDAGAIPYVVNGADVMRPGIVSVSDDVKIQAPVQIVDERHGKPLAIGIALLDAPDMRARISGKMCKNFHHVSDEIWNIEI